MSGWKDLSPGRAENIVNTLEDSAVEEGSSAVHSPITSRVNYVFLLIVHPLQLSVSSATEPGDFFDVQ